MKKLLSKLVLSSVVTLLMTIAAAGAASACAVLMYQPELPEE